MTDSTSNGTRPPGWNRGVLAVAIALVAVGSACGYVGSAQASSYRVPSSQPLVVLLGNHIARPTPNSHARRIETVNARRPLTRVRTVLPVLGRVGRGERSWLHVRLPGRPNSHTGWISSFHTRNTSTKWHIWVTLSARRVTIYQDGRIRRQFRAVVGKPSTPTPRGQFFIEEALALSLRESGAPFALATSARSDVLHEFDGGPGQIAIHGTDNLPGAPGSAASHGCVRLSTANITWMSRRIGSGVPLTITR